MRPMAVAPRLTGVLGLDLTGSADDCRQILLGDLGGQYLGVARLLLIDEASYKPANDENDEDNQQYFFHVQFVLQDSPESVYAILFCPVPVGVSKLPLRPGEDRRLPVSGFPCG